MTIPKKITPSYLRYLAGRAWAQNNHNLAKFWEEKAIQYQNEHPELIKPKEIIHIKR